MATQASPLDGVRELFSDIFALVKDRTAEARQATGTKSPDDADLKIAVLSSVESDAKNAAEIARSVALASAGILQPSTAALHTILKSLTEEKLLSAKLDGDRKVYSITKAGKTALKNAPEPEAKGGGNSRTGSTASRLNFDPEFFKSASKLAPVMLDIAQTASPKQQKQASQVLEETRNQLHAILADKH